MRALAIPEDLMHGIRVINIPNAHKKHAHCSFGCYALPDRPPGGGTGHVCEGV